MSSTIMSAVADVDAAMDKVRGLITFASKRDPELAAGVATAGEMPATERKVNQALAATEEVDSYLRALTRR